jgi:hypothetical protein
LECISAGVEFRVPASSYFIFVGRFNSIFDHGIVLVCSSSKESYSFLVKYLATFAGEDAVTLSEAKEEAVRAVIEFVKSPDMFQVCDFCPHLVKVSKMSIMSSC